MVENNCIAVKDEGGYNIMGACTGAMYLTTIIEKKGLTGLMYTPDRCAI